jgi:tight adherence protein C
MISELSCLRWSCAALISGAVALFVYAILCAPSRATSRLGTRGLRRQRALQDPLWRRVEPSISWMGTRLSGVLSDPQTAVIDRQLVLAGDYMGLSAPEYVALSLISLGLGVVAALLSVRAVHMGPILFIALAFLGASLPYLVISGEAESRLKSISRRLPTAIDLIALAMSAGLDFPAAIRQVIEKSSDPYDALIEELGWILHKLSLGNTRRQALEEFAVRAPTDVVLEFVGAVSQAEERGHPISRVLQVQATTSRERRSVRAEESAAKAGVALAGPLMLLFLAIILLIMAPMVLRLGASALFHD